MSEDPRCCGSGTCSIDIEGRRRCGRQCDDRKTGQALLLPVAPAVGDPAAAPACAPPGGGHDLQGLPPSATCSELPGAPGTQGAPLSTECPVGVF